MQTMNEVCHCHVALKITNERQEISLSLAGPLGPPTAILRISHLIFLYFSTVLCAPSPLYLESMGGLLDLEVYSPIKITRAQRKAMSNLQYWI